MRLANKVAVVTGAARGIGRASAERLLAEGAKVVIADVDSGKFGDDDTRVVGDVPVTAGRWDTMLKPNLSC